MITEIVLKTQPILELEGYEKIEIPNGVLFASSIEKRIEVVIKKHPDEMVSLFTDKSEVIKKIIETSEIIDLHIK
ncbi:MAG: hypothetical protein WBC21_02850 [Minisyncoccales bacterium]